MTKTIYNYHPQTGEFISATPADESPLERGVFLIPAYATDTAPPTTGTNQVAVYSGGKWAVKDISAPPAPDPVAVLAAVKTNALDRIATFAKAKRATIAGTSDDAEIAGWNNKLRIAQAIVAGTATDGEKAAFQAEITARGIKGETLAIFTQKVITNAGFFAQAVGLIDGLKRKAQDSIAVAKTPDEVAAVLNGMKAQADAAFAQLMQATK